MENLTTDIYWILNDYCKSECSYCPQSISGGGMPPETVEYIRIANLLINSYAKIGRKINWTITGGEPLDMFDIVTLLKLCRTQGNSVTLNTNGGRLWIDWWAIEPYVDRLDLTFHYWQTPHLIKFITDTFKNKNKEINVTSPIRPDHYEADMERVSLVEATIGIKITRTYLYKDAQHAGGKFNYSFDQLTGINNANGVIPIVQITSSEESWNDRYQAVYSSNPSYSGQMCNAGIEYLFIGGQGWASGSHCGNESYGNIWHTDWAPPMQPQKCGMLACIHSADQKITKFPLPDL